MITIGDLENQKKLENLDLGSNRKLPIHLQRQFVKSALQKALHIHSHRFCVGGLWISYSETRKTSIFTIFGTSMSQLGLETFDFVPSFLSSLSDACYYIVEQDSNTNEKKSEKVHRPLGRGATRLRGISSIVYPISWFLSWNETVLKPCFFVFS